MIDSLRAEHRLKDLLRAARLPKATYYDHRKRLAAPDRHADLKAVLCQIFEDAEGRYGYRRLHAELAKQGWRVASKTVRKLMKDMDLYCPIRRKNPHRLRVGAIGAVAPNLLKRRFTVTAPNRVWATDVTQFAVCGTTVYLSSIIDLFDRQVIAYDAGPSPSIPMVHGMLQRALATLPPGQQVMVHSDQGWQYTHTGWQHLLREAGAIQSMSRKATCLDNAVIERHFGTIKDEVFRHTTYRSVSAFHNALHRYMHWYNHERCSLTRGGMSPVQYRAAWAAANHVTYASVSSPT